MRVDATNPCIRVVMASRYKALRENQRRPEAVKFLEKTLARGPHADTGARTDREIGKRFVLHSAVTASDSACVEWWVAHNPGLLPEGRGGYPALHIAAAQGDLAMVRLLLQAGEDANTMNGFGQTAAEVARARGKPEVLDFLLKAGGSAQRPDEPRADAHAPGTRPQEPLPIRAAHASPGEEPDALLRKAIEAGDCEQIARALDAGAHKEAVEGEWFNSPLCMAVRRGALKPVELLLKRGASAQAPCKAGRTAEQTPLHLAASEGDPAMIELLLAHGARARPGMDGMMPITAALRSPEKKRAEAVRLLRRAGPSKGDMTLLYVAPNLVLGGELELKGSGRRAVVGLRPEIVLKRPYGLMGGGVYGEASTHAFDDGLVGGGLVLIASSPVVPSIGVYSRHATGTGWNPGLTAGVFVGSYRATQAKVGDVPRTPPSVRLAPGGNFGLRVDVRWGRVPEDRLLAIAFQMDLDLLWLVPWDLLAASTCCG